MKAYRVWRIDPKQPTPVVESSAYELFSRAERLALEYSQHHHGRWDPPISFEVREEDLPATWRASTGTPIRMCFVLMGHDEEQTDLDIGGKRCGRTIVGSSAATGRRAWGIKSMNDLISDTFRHCDDYIEDPTAPEVLRKYLDRARSPAHGHLSKEPFPKLFATYKGERYRVTMASRLGDVGISPDLGGNSRYSIRVAVSDLSDFGDRP